MADAADQAGATRDSQVRIASYLLEKVHDEFDEELLALCETYAAKHTALRKGLQKLRQKERESRLYDEPALARIRSIFDRPFDSRLGMTVFTVTTLLVLLSVIVLMLRSVPRYNPVVRPEYEQTWLWIEGSVTIYFTLEFALRLLASEDKIDHMKRVTTIADFIALVPFYLEVMTQVDIGFLQAFRLLRIFVFFRRFRSVDSLFHAVWDSVRVLGAPLVFLGTCLFIVSTLLYYTERGTYQPDQRVFTIRDCECESSPAFIFGNRDCPRRESHFFSIPHTLWWGVVTMTTVGYGDLVPTCPNGKVVAAVSMVLGVLFMAMPIAIVGNYFTLSVRKREEIKTKAFLEKCRQRADVAPGLDSDTGNNKGASRSVRFLRFLHERLQEPTLSVADPTPYAMMLLDYYFGALPFAAAGGNAPAAVSYELRRITDATTIVDDPVHARDTGAPTLRSAPKRMALNRAVTLVVGVVSASSGMPPPDVELPSADAAGIPYRLSQRHATITMPPQYGDQAAVLRPLPGSSVWINDALVPEGGRELRQGDVVDFHGPDRPLAYRVDGVHPFALDL
jgi:predicted membrane channel-forming protein YqfA (hemolysin III family)